MASPRAARLRELEDEPPEWLTNAIGTRPGRSKSVERRRARVAASGAGDRRLPARHAATTRRPTRSARRRSSRRPARISGPSGRSPRSPTNACAAQGHGPRRLSRRLAGTWAPGPSCAGSGSRAVCPAVCGLSSCDGEDAEIDEHAREGEHGRGDHHRYDKCCGAHLAATGSDHRLRAWVGSRVTTSANTCAQAANSPRTASATAKGCVTTHARVRSVGPKRSSQAGQQGGHTGVDPPRRGRLIEFAKFLRRSPAQEEHP